MKIKVKIDKKHQGLGARLCMALPDFNPGFSAPKERHHGEILAIMTPDLLQIVQLKCDKTGDKVSKY